MVVGRGFDGDFTDTGSERWWHLTDVQFSTVAIIDDAAVVAERIQYDAYGRAYHHQKHDVDGDGDFDSTDRGVVQSLAGFGAQGAPIESGVYEPDADIDRDGDVDFNDVTLIGTNYASALSRGELSNATVKNTIGWDGYVFNPEHEMYTVRFRWYSPELGRWVERDPMGYTDGPSLLQYVGSDPAAFNDPTGLDRIDATVYDEDGQLYADLFYVDEACLPWNCDDAPAKVGRFNFSSGWVELPGGRVTTVKQVVDFANEWGEDWEEFEEEHGVLPTATEQGNKQAGLGGAYMYWALLESEVCCSQLWDATPPQDRLDAYEGFAGAAVSAIRQLMMFYVLAPLDIVAMLRAASPLSLVDNIAVQRNNKNLEKYQQCWIAGKLGENTVGGQLLEEGYQIVGSQIYVRTPEGNRIVDYLVRGPNGTVFAVEVKVGTTGRKAPQIIRDNALALQGGVAHGTRAQWFGIDGQVFQCSTEVRHLPRMCNPR